jgi:hypothetical protein
LLNDDRLYAASNENLYVYSLSDFTSPIATIPISQERSLKSSIIFDDRLYLGGENIQVFKVTASLTQPLIPLTIISTEEEVLKILRVGNELLLGEVNCYMEVVDINTSKITSTHKFTEGGYICDIVPIDETRYLVAALHGLLKTTKDQLIRH